ncbi:MAG: type II toxin-antitoxin system VapC family toxin [Blastocatellia bacterium]
MNFLLDTHTFIWWTMDQARLSSKARALMQDRENKLFLSHVSIWEIQLKTQLGRLGLPLPLSDLVDEQQRQNGIQLMPIQPRHIYALGQLAYHHTDPFDRLLIAQAITENLQMISADHVFPAYPLNLIW